MSRSRRHTPIMGVTTAESEKQDKRRANRALRRRVKTILLKDPEADVIPTLEEVSDIWSFEKDGKMYGTFEGWDRK